MFQTVREQYEKKRVKDCFFFSLLSLAGSCHCPVESSMVSDSGENEGVNDAMNVIGNSVTKLTQFTVIKLVHNYM